VEVLESLEVPGAGRIELCVGDLTAMAGADAVDLLVASAFPSSYVPTPDSLIGALFRRGVSVEDAAAHKLAEPAGNVVVLAVAADPFGGGRARRS
jgi:hypothetical protein